MRVERLSARGFRNLAPLELRPGPHFNVVHGDNGAGKSNLLEAIHYLAALRSFRGARTDDLLALGQDDARLEATVTGHLAPRALRIQLSRGKARQVQMDGKRPRSAASWYGSVQSVLFSPADLVLGGGAPEARRVFLDRMLEQLDPTYASARTSYERALRSRNRLLKMDQVDRRSVIAYDELLASAGEVIAQARARLTEELSPATERGFTQVHGETMHIEVRYAPRVAPNADAIRDALARSLDKDLARGFTAEGPHADDLAFVVKDRAPLKHHASQGQQRALVLALKIAELDVLARRAGRVPLLLLDDVSSELDRARNRRLFEVLARLGGQVFLTTTHPEFILIDQERSDFRVENGRVTPA